jgi:hypothetical protein
MLTLKEAQVILRALDHTPQNRWPTCTAMIDQLAKAVKRPARS